MTSITTCPAFPYLSKTCLNKLESSACKVNQNDVSLITQIKTLPRNDQDNDRPVNEIGFL